MTTETIQTTPEVLVYRYAKLTEHNEHEGETWHYFIPVEGNEEALDTLKRILEPEKGADGTDGEDPEFSLDDHSYPAYDVRVLTQHGADGYAAQFARLEGYLAFDTDDGVAGVVSGPERPPVLNPGEDLYKGGIKDYMTERPERVVYGVLSFDPENPR